MCVCAISITQAKENSSAGPRDELKIAEEISFLWSDLQPWSFFFFPLPAAFLCLWLYSNVLFTELDLGSKY